MGSTSIVHAVPASILELVLEDVVHNLTQRIRLGGEVTGHVQNHSVNADVTEGNGPGVVQSAVTAWLACQKESRGLPTCRVIAACGKYFEIKEGVMGTNPFGLIRTSSPVSIWPLLVKKRFSPPFLCDAALGCPQISFIYAEQIPFCLICN